MKKMTIAGIAMSLSMICPLVSQAQVLWGSAQNITGNSDVNNQGNTVAAYAFTGNAATANGVSFTSTTNITGAVASYSLANLMVTSSGNDIFGSNVGNPFATGNNPNASLDPEIRVITANGLFGGASTFTLSLTSLSLNTNYLVQLWVNDSRSFGLARSETVTSVGGNSVVLNFNTGTGDGGLGQWVTGTFNTGSSTSQDFTILGNVATQINALQLRDLGVVPEPSVAALLGLAGLASLMLRNKKVRV
jgi:hypothetical protein